MKYKLLQCNAEGGSEKSMTVWARENKKDFTFYSKLHLIWKQKKILTSIYKKGFFILLWEDC